MGLLQLGLEPGDLGLEALDVLAQPALERRLLLLGLLLDRADPLPVAVDVLLEVVDLGVEPAANLIVFVGGDPLGRRGLGLGQPLLQVAEGGLLVGVGLRQAGLELGDLGFPAASAFASRSLRSLSWPSKVWAAAR